MGQLPRPPSDRLESVDLLRGVVMVIMALDHVRDYFSDRWFMNPVDLETTTAGIFVTRWVTHFCAPTFIFLAGTGAYLQRARGKPRAELAAFLFTRGMWLAVFEITVNRAAWWFNWSLYEHGAGVFWAIGLSMMVLAWLVFLPTWAVTAFGVVMIATHNRLDGLTVDHVGLPRLIWVILHSPGRATVFGPVTFETGYCLIPWCGVMAAGYGFGSVLRLDPPARRRWLFLLGTAVTLGFIALRAANVYGDASKWSVQPNPLFTMFSFLNCTKYPPSLLYVLMTLGPAILFLAAFDGRIGPVAKPLITFGRVPMFFYLLHIPLIHGGAVVLDYIRFGWSPMLNNGPWFGPKNAPPGYGVNLLAVYLIWVLVVLLLYPACQWYAAVKRRSRSVWLSYL